MVGSIGVQGWPSQLARAMSQQGKGNGGEGKGDNGYDARQGKDNGGGFEPTGKGNGGEGKGVNGYEAMQGKDNGGKGTATGCQEGMQRRQGQGNGGKGKYKCGGVKGFEPTGNTNDFQGKCHVPTGKGKVGKNIQAWLDLQFAVVLARRS